MWVRAVRFCREGSYKVQLCACFPAIASKIIPEGEILLESVMLSAQTGVSQDTRAKSSRCDKLKYVGERSSSTNPRYGVCSLVV
jgi:hypothetical protein